MSAHDIIPDRHYGGSFAATAQWLRDVERHGALSRGALPPHRGRRVARTAAWAAGVAGTIAACALPVQQTETIGYYIRAHSSHEIADTYSRMRTLPWVDRTLVFAVADGSTSGDGSTILLAAQGATHTDVLRWVRDLHTLALDSAAAVPLQANVTRPLYRAAAHSLFGVTFDADTLPADDIERHIQAQLDQLPGGSIAVKTDGASQTRLISLPRMTPSDGSGASYSEVVVPDSEEIVLLVLKRNADGVPPDTLWISLDAGEYASGTDSERNGLVRRALAARGIERVEITFANGVVRIRSQ